MNKKLIALLLTLVLLVGVVAGGTIAWLTAKTAPVTNTFTVGDINIELKEHKLGDDGKLSDTETVTENTYAYVPGDTLPKDPYVTVTDASEACYLFIRIQEKNNTVAGLTGKVVSYKVADGWTQYEENSEYWYRTVAKEASPKKFDVLADNEVSINSGITKAMVTTLNTGATQPKLVITAAAVQQSHIETVQAAFAELPAEFKATS